VPKLLMTFQGSPRCPLATIWRAGAAGNVAALETVYRGGAGHHAPEDRPDEIAAAISAWADRHWLR
jgi:haloalkane dehalogenase